MAHDSEAPSPYDFCDIINIHQISVNLHNTVTNTSKPSYTPSIGKTEYSFCSC